MIYNNMRHSLSMLEILGRANVLESALPLGIRTSQYASDVWLEDGAFFRLENVTAGYTIPLEVKFVDRLRISVTGNNLLLFTNYSGADPEINVSGSNAGGFSLNTFGGDRGAYPRARSFAVGLNVVFK